MPDDQSAKTPFPTGYDEHGNCTRPDRDVPRIRCGYPFPCPWHTATIDLTGDMPSVREAAARPLTPTERDVAYRVANVVADQLEIDRRERHKGEHVRNAPNRHKE